MPEVRPINMLELLAGAAAAACATLIVAAIVSASGFSALDPAAGALGPVWAAAMVAIALAGYAVQRRADARSARWVLAILAGVAVGVVMLPLWAGLHGTPQPPFTVLRGDMTFRTEYITRFASTWRLRDYTFGGLDAFYPPAWFWLAGRTAHVLGIEPWRIVKPFTIGTTAAALGLAYLLWRRVLTPAGALAAAIGSSLVLTRQMQALGPSAHATQGWYSPYSAFVAVTGIAWLAATATAARAGASRRGWTMLVAAGALLALSYYLLFVILAVVLVALAVAGREGRRAALLRAGGALGGVAALTAVFWVPLVASVAGSGAAQGHYLAPDFLEVQVGFDGPAELVVLMVAVVAALALGATWTAARAVIGLVAATVIYQVVSATSLVFSENQLQPHRAVTMLWATLGAAVPVALEGFAREGALARGLPPAASRACAIVLAVVASGAAFVAGERQGSDLVSGPLTLGAHDPVDMRTPRAIARFITTTAGRPAQDLTLLGGEKEAVLVIAPFNGYLALSARYAHPAAQQAARVRAVVRAADCPTPACTTRALTQTPYGPIDALVLTRVGVGYELLAQTDAFPEPRLTTVDFPPANFDPATWAVRAFGAYVAIVRRPAGQAAAASAPSGTSRHRPAPVSTRAVRPGRSASSGRAASGRSARTPRSS